MEWLSGIKEISEAEKANSDEKPKFDEKTLGKYDKILGDDKIEVKNSSDESESRLLSSSEREQKFRKLFDFGDMFKGIGKMTATDGQEASAQKTESEQSNGLELSEKTNPNLEYVQKDKQNETNEGKEAREGLTDEQKEKLRELTGWSDEIIDAIGSWEEAEIYMKAGLKEVEINGKKCLIRGDIDLDQEDEDGITNRERMERGRPPITKDGEEVELHHIGQKPDSPLAELTTEQHRGVGNDTILHDKTKESEIDRNKFGSERREHWKDRVASMEGEE